MLVNAERPWYNKAVLLILISSAYGIILAKWYQANPLEGRFGDNGFLDSFGIVLSAIFLLLPIYILTSNQVKSEERKGKK